MTKLDEIMPVYDVFDKHQVRIQGTPEAAYAVLNQLDFSDSWLIQTLFTLRGLKSASFNDVKENFTLLYDNPPQEIVLGAIAQPWNLIKGLKPITREDFYSFDLPNYAKLAWNFTFEKQGSDVLITTETRVKCLDTSSRRKFKIYWFFVHPFSALVRKEMLRLIERKLKDF